MRGNFVEVNCNVDVDLDDVKDNIKTYYDPQDIFGDDELSKWAENNGFVKEE